MTVGVPMAKDNVTEAPAAYYGAVESELTQARRTQRFLALADQRRLFGHHGQLELSADAAVLGDWMRVARSDITRIELTFTSAYSRWMAAGCRGRTPSFGVFASLGKPIIITTQGRERLYLLIRPRWWSGINDNRRWHPRLLGWLNDPSTPDPANEAP